MALADYFRKNAVAAAQVIAGFDEERLEASLNDQVVGITIGPEAASAEGTAALDLLVRLIARLYPTLAFRGENADRVRNLAQRINPRVSFAEVPTIEIILGSATPSSTGSHLFVGADAWHASISAHEHQPIGTTNNILGAGVAACMAASRVFRFVLLGEVFTSSERFSAFDTSDRNPTLPADLGDAILVGIGAIGNAASWAIAQLKMNGTLHLVDHETVDLGNLQRYVLTERSDEAQPKTAVISRHFTGAIRATQHRDSLEEFLNANGYRWNSMLLALDSASDRRAAQASLPQWIANAWTQPGDLGVSTHYFTKGACVACLYLPRGVVESEDTIIAKTLGVPDRALQIRELLYRQQGVPRELLDAIGQAHQIPIERLLPFENSQLRMLYVEGFCGGAALPLGRVGNPRGDVHVPLAHQSALAGILLAAAAVRHAMNPDAGATEITRVDLHNSAPRLTRQRADKDRRGICICQDPDYVHTYTEKYMQRATDGAVGSRLGARENRDV